MIKSKKEITKIVQNIVGKYNPQRIILFGSYAYGNPSKDSDVDLLVIKDTKTPRPKREQEIYKLLATFNKNRRLSVDIIVHTPSETSERVRLGDPFIKEVMSKGQLLYQSNG